MTEGGRVKSDLHTTVHGQAGAGHPELEQEDDEEDDHVLGAQSGEGNHGTAFSLLHELYLL